MRMKEILSGLKISKVKARFFNICMNEVWEMVKRKLEVFDIE